MNPKVNFFVKCSSFKKQTTHQDSWVDTLSSCLRKSRAGLFPIGLEQNRLMLRMTAEHILRLSPRPKQAAQMHILKLLQVLNADTPELWCGWRVSLQQAILTHVHGSLPRGTVGIRSSGSHPFSE